MKIINWLKGIDTRLLLIADQSLMSAAGFLSNFLLAWKLQLEGYGVYALVYLGMMLLMSLQQALFIQPAQVYLSKLSDKGQQKYSGMILLFALPIIILSSSVFEFVFRIIYTPDLPIGILTLVASVWLLSDLLRKLCIIIKPSLSLILIDTINVLLFSVLILVVSPTTPAVALVLLGITSLTGLLFLVVIKPAKSGKIMKGYFIKRTSATAGWMVVTAGVQWSSSNYLLMAAGAWISAASLGLLRLTQYLFGLLNIFLQAYENFAVPKVAAWTGQASGKTNYVLKVSAAFLLPVAGLLILLTILFPFVAKLITPQVIDEPLHLWIALLYVLILFAYPIRVLIRASGYNQIYFAAHVAALFLTLLTAKFFIQNYLSIGIILGMILSQLLMALIWIAFLYRRKHLAWKLSTSL
jgi:O-antigen/teichoic acid export membrane protein